MTLRSHIRAIEISALISLSLLCTARLAGSGATPDTPESLMATAKTYAASLKAGMALATKFYQDLSTNRAFATNVLSAAQNEDKQAVAKAIAADLKLSVNQVTVEKIDKDLLAQTSITMAGGKVVTVCIDTDKRKRCPQPAGGYNSSVTVGGGQ